MGVGSAEWQSWPSIDCDPLMRMTGVSTRTVLANNPEEISPSRVKSICSHFKARRDMTQPSRKAVVKANPIFAKAVDSRASKYKASPATGILDFFVATPDRPGKYSAANLYRVADPANDMMRDLHSVSKLLFLPP